ncbi:hypothetical protein ONS96_011476 [Cadophora gregata f. sp. sojae]|nr:hypothetical protein ONS96_011476 [Cadophora gregata f. sp. sojae]
MADVEDDFAETPAPEYPTGSGKRRKQGDSSAHQFHSTISRDASNGHDKYPIFSEAQLRKDSDDEEPDLSSKTPANLFPGSSSKWNEHAQFAADYIKASKYKGAKPPMPQSLNDRPDMSTARATARTNGLDRVRSSYDRPTPAEPMRSSRPIVEWERQRYSPPSTIEEADDEGIYHPRSRSPSPIRVLRSSPPPPPPPGPDSRRRRRVVEPERVSVIERSLPVRRPPGTSHGHHNPEFSGRRVLVSQKYDPDMEEGPRYQAPLPLPRASTFARPYDYLDEIEPIPAPPRSASKRKYPDHAKHEDPHPAYDYSPDIPSNDQDIRYNGPELWRSYEADQVESEDDLNSTWTPETVAPLRQRPPVKKYPSKAPSYRILCRVECDVVHERRHTEDRVHPALIFEDVPHWNPRFTKTKGHLTGFRPIYSLSQWLKSIDPLSFVVYRTYLCSWSSFKTIPRDGTLDMPTLRVADSEAKDFNESIEVLSSELEEALLSVAKCKIECFTGLQDADSRSGNLIFDSPYLFFYHHRAVLSELSKQGDERLRREVFPLLIYLKERQKALYRQADHHFAKKTTDANVLKFLFCPNEIVVSKTKKSDIECAYAIRYLHFFPDDSIELICWAWTYDGTELKRREKKIDVRYKAGNARSVLKLAAYPLRFAPEELRAKLFARGTRFWELRTPQLVTYKGMNFLQEKYIVSASCSLTV